jgi:hypothetical protein
MAFSKRVRLAQRVMCNKGGVRRPLDMTARLRKSLVVLSSASLLAGSACRHKPPYVEPPPNWRWADVGRRCTPDSPATELTAAARDSTGHPFGMARKSSVWETRAAIAAKIPGGWGGLAAREKKTGFAIYLTDTAQRSAALAALAAAGVPYISPVTEAEQARWTYVQLYDWFRYIHTHLRHVAVNSWALDEWRNRIYYGVEDETAALELDRQLAALNVPCFLVIREVVGQIRVN